MRPQAAGEPSFALPAGYAFAYPRLAGELYVGGVYVRLFLKTPKFAIRNPRRFVEGLMDRRAPPPPLCAFCSPGLLQPWPAP
jgi:hypothetical protein